MPNRQQFQAVIGTKDILPEESLRYRKVSEVLRGFATSAGYSQIATPILQDSAMYERIYGNTLNKMFYHVNDYNAGAIILRPFGTLGIVRAYLENGLADSPQPVRLYYEEEMFKAGPYDERSEAQFRQFGIEVLGETSPSIDAQIIAFACRALDAIGIEEYTLQINTMGDKGCRSRYNTALQVFLDKISKFLSPIEKERIRDNPIRILSTTDESVRKMLLDAPQILNYLSEDDQNHFSNVLEYLDFIKISYELDPYLMPDTEFNNRTVFQFRGRGTGSGAILGSGGRSDDLAEILGGTRTPAAGLSFNIGRLIANISESAPTVNVLAIKRVYVACLGEPARLAAFSLIERLLDEDIPSSGAIDRDGIGSQLARAEKLGVPYAIIIGQREVQDGTVLLRDMISGAQETISAKNIIFEVKQRFSRHEHL